MNVGRCCHGAQTHGPPTWGGVFPHSSWCWTIYIYVYIYIYISLDGRTDWMETPCRSRHSRTSWRVLACTDGCSGSASRCKVSPRGAGDWFRETHRSPSQTNSHYAGHYAYFGVKGVGWETHDSLRNNYGKGRARLRRGHLAVAWRQRVPVRRTE